MAKYPWPEIKAKYETGIYTIEKLAKEYGFSCWYGYRKARENNWVKGKSSEEVQLKATKKVIEQEVNKEVKIRQEYQKIINYIRRDTANELSAKDPETGKRITDFLRLKELKISTEIIHNCRKEDWELLEIKEVAKQIEQEANVNIKEEIPYEQRMAAIKMLGGAFNGRPVTPPADNGSQN